jgi:hypothetical protein
MTDVLRDGFTRSQAMGIALAVRKGVMSEADADQRDRAWRVAAQTLAPVRPDQPTQVEEVVVTTKGPDWLHRQMAKIAYGLHDILTPAPHGVRYGGFGDGSFHPGNGVRHVQDLERRQHAFEAQRRGWRSPHPVMKPRGPQATPPGVTLEQLRQQAEALGGPPWSWPRSDEEGAAQWINSGLQWVNRVKPGGEWDFKRNGHPEHEQFGNEAYGVTGRAVGLSPEILKRGAGFAQETFKTGDSYHPEFGHWWGSAPYGDDPRDQADIQRGIDWHAANGARKRRPGQPR